MRRGAEHAKERCVIQRKRVEKPSRMMADRLSIEAHMFIVLLLALQARPRNSTAPQWARPANLQLFGLERGIGIRPCPSRRGREPRYMFIVNRLTLLASHARAPYGSR
jgi:hypothetical protein